MRPGYGIGSLAAAIAILAPTVALAHPHIFIDAREEAIFEGRRLTAVKHIWRFDEAFSAFAMQGLDKDRDGSLSDAELAPLAKANVTALAAFDYYTYVSVDGVQIGSVALADYALEADDGRLTLVFTLRIDAPQAVANTAAIQVYDLDYYTAFTFTDDPVRLIGAPADCAVTYERPQPLDERTLTIIYAIPADQRVVPPELREALATVTHVMRVACE